MDKFKLMQTYIRVSEQGSFTAVANQMGVPRSLITRQIAELERLLGVKLMTRSTRRLSLTNAGSAYLERCREILNLIDATESGLAQDRFAPKGPIRIGLPLSYGLKKLQPILMDFVRQNIDIQLALDFSDKHIDLIQEGLDLSIRITANLESTDIVRKFGSCELISVASPSYLLNHGEPNRPEELVNHVCLDYSLQPSFSVWTYYGETGPVNVNISGRLVANNGNALVQAAALGLGIARQPDFIAEEYLHNQSVVQILKEFNGPRLGIYAVLPSNRYIPHRVSVLMDYIADRLK